jgi:hypothetical protein
MHIDEGKAAAVIAENVVTILKLRPVKCGVASANHEVVLAGLVRELLSVMPTASSDVLAAACNRFLDQLASIDEERRPWVEAVDPIGGCVTMREGKRANAFKGHSGSGFP